jgi:O-antigen ligase
MIRIPVNRTFAFLPATAIACLYGVLDSAVWIASFTFPEDEVDVYYFSLYYYVSVPLKALIFACLARKIEPAHVKPLLLFLLAIVVTACASVISGTSNLVGITQPIGILVSLIMTILALNSENISIYMKAFGLSCLISCIAFFLQFFFVPLNTSGISDVYGRYTFISGTHPNFGGELLCTGFIAFCFARSSAKVIIPIFLLYLVTLTLLQSRAALLSLILAFSLITYFDHVRRFAPVNRLAVVSCVALLLLFAMALDFNRISDFLLLDDEYRGIGTGYVGREERWAFSWNLFLQYPLFGAGFGFFRQESMEDFAPHSMWYYMISTMGLMSLVVVAEMVRNGWRVYTINARAFLLLISFIPMTLFNNRFLNLNPYPFLFYVILFMPQNVLVGRLTEHAVRAARPYVQLKKIA